MTRRALRELSDAGQNYTDYEEHGMGRAGDGDGGRGKVALKG
ncbi:MAG: hypothetical protein M5U10_15370 [Candidatus Methanoperedens sp.]|nr:hypothetical protein [Candidatus Methanoperedens sp.]